MLTIQQEKDLLNKINNHDIKGWEELYDRYANVLLGGIFVLTQDKEISENILIDFFVKLKQENKLAALNSKIFTFLYSQVIQFTGNELKKYGLQPCLESIATAPKVVQALFKINLLNEVVLKQNNSNSKPVYSNKMGSFKIPISGQNIIESRN